MKARPAHFPSPRPIQKKRLATPKRQSPDTANESASGLGLKGALLLLAVVLAGVIAWQLTSLLIMLFSAILIALLLVEFARLLTRYSGMGYALSLTIVVAFILVLISVFLWLLGSQIWSEMSDLAKRAPELLSAANKYIDVGDLEDWVRERMSAMVGQRSIVGDLTGISAIIISVPINIFLATVGGVYFASNPRLYRHGLLKLVPKASRPKMAETLSAVATSLRHWFLGQLLSMLCIGILTTIGLLLLGISSPFALGFIAGILEFVPYVGPIISAIPAMAVALGQDPWDVLWVGLLYFAVQQSEGTLILPVIQEHTVKIPPGLLIFSILGFGILLGPGGMVFGAPLTVVSFVLVQRLWVERQQAGRGEAEQEPVRASGRPKVRRP